MLLETIVNYAYLLAAVMFILGLMWMTAVPTARRGNLVSSLGMLIAAVATLFLVQGDQFLSLAWIAGALVVGSVIGLLLAVRTSMTGMPQMVALLNGFGGIASLLVAWGDYETWRGKLDSTLLDAFGVVVTGNVNDIPIARHGYEFLAIGLTVLVGGVTFTGSLVAFGKLQGLKITPGRPIQFPGQQIINAALVLISLAAAVMLVVEPTWGWLIVPIAIASLVLGVMLVIGIGGADMPVVISLLNSYSGIAAAFAGFVLNNSALIITGALVGASGIILTSIMCKAMNRSLLNVLFGGVGGSSGSSGGASGGGGVGGKAGGQVREFSMEDAGIVLDAARQVMIVPGYGMAVAQAQHSVKELADELERRGIVVKYAIHPVAGRMPGHMNVLLAEANVPYENLLDLEQSNAEFEQTDVALVIGANDVTNPAARTATDSPIYGMPILDVDKARTIFVIKRSMNTGFAGVENELYYNPKTAMLFGDAKKIVSALTSELKNG